MKNYYKKVGKPYKAADALHVDFPNFGGRGVPRGPTMVPQVSSHRLFNTSRRCIWYRLARICDASFDWGLPTPSLGGKGVCMGSEIAPLSSPGTISYRLPIVTIGLSLTVFAVLRMFQTDGQTGGRNLSSNGRHFALKCIGRQNRSTSAEVILKIKLARFYGPRCVLLATLPREMSVRENCTELKHGNGSANTH